MTDETQTSPETESALPPEPTEPDIPGEVELDCVDLMLEGDLKSQVNYSFVKAIAAVLDEKVRLLEDVEKEIREAAGPHNFVEEALPEIQTMAQVVTEGCVDFGGIHYWEACETAEIAWEETKDAEGNLIGRFPYCQSHDEPREGNRLLKNLETITVWLRALHELHEEKGMGWVSPYGCPEDGQHEYDRRAEWLVKLDEIIQKVKTNREI